MSVAARLLQVRERIAAAARRAGRSPTEVRLVAVTKGHPLTAVREVVDAGCAHLGENYVQELIAKMDAVASAELRWHLIGPLQRNKVRQVVGRVSLIHTVDTPRLAAELEKRAAGLGIEVELLCQVNVAGEAQKHGASPSALGPLLEAISAQPHLRLRGLMTIPPLADDPVQTRPHFRALRTLRDDLRRSHPSADLDQLSMGMSDDFEVAVEEGATLVRIGTALLGSRPPRRGEEEEEEA